MSRRWEYKLISTNDVPGGSWLGMKEREAVEAYLNQLGTEGWEIVGIDFTDATQSPNFFQALARRER
ncbi:MAG: DUF4177 domain-containing protein [Gemmatimonas sp.]|jgi:hypothetical protein|uniref:DUF4177 domain-containing protein n=1 Tax=Gemmatimonas sp. TaxID=1962908 RepID=UPI0022C70E7E|nr:DUF4177 domain-containing protein [Gemmatimonas sp.]MCA2988900.1 DUF4177 domain-containing protein [Gemmatimonas sp.]MCZ8011311.1 DUF4177 domain-containing protein [Gemmatimonas sp.]